jgi:hypothetical protein
VPLNLAVREHREHEGVAVLIVRLFAAIESSLSPREISRA